MLKRNTVLFLLLFFSPMYLIAETTEDTGSCTYTLDKKARTGSCTCSAHGSPYGLTSGSPAEEQTAKRKSCTEARRRSNLMMEFYRQSCNPCEKGDDFWVIQEYPISQCAYSLADPKELAKSNQSSSQGVLSAGQWAVVTSTMAGVCRKPEEEVGEIPESMVDAPEEIKEDTPLPKLDELPALPPPPKVVEPPKEVPEPPSSLCRSSDAITVNGRPAGSLVNLKIGKSITVKWDSARALQSLNPHCTMAVVDPKNGNVIKSVSEKEGEITLAVPKASPLHVVSLRCDGAEKESRICSVTVKSKKR